MHATYVVNTADACYVVNTADACYYVVNTADACYVVNTADACYVRSKHCWCMLRSKHCWCMLLRSKHCWCMLPSKHCCFAVIYATYHCCNNPEGSDEEEGDQHVADGRVSADGVRGVSGVVHGVTHSDEGCAPGICLLLIFCTHVTPTWSLCLINDCQIQQNTLIYGWRCRQECWKTARKC